MTFVSGGHDMNDIMWHVKTTREQRHTHPHPVSRLAWFTRTSKHLRTNQQRDVVSVLSTISRVGSFFIVYLSLLMDGWIYRSATRDQSAVFRYFRKSSVTSRDPRLLIDPGSADKLLCLTFFKIAH
jgi:hypothetical protein